MRSIAILSLLVILSAPAAAEVASIPEGLHVRSTGAGVYILDQAQQSLYWNEGEAASGNLICIEECLETWNPLIATADIQSKGNWRVFTRPEGTRQWAYKELPLYTFVNDTFPGARLGDGLGRLQWRVFFEPRQVPPGMKVETTYLGHVLADHRGRTLYTQTVSDGANTQLSSLDHWTPFKAPWMALDQGEWTVQFLADGIRQWSYQGRLLFTYNKDTDPQEVHGHAVNNEWSAVILEPAPGLPPWITIQSIDIGLAYANQEGLTIYAPVDWEAIKVAQTCPEQCMQENWRAILAKSGEKSIGNWVIVENDDGQLQWSYRGQLLYTHTRDQKPGEMKGNGIGVGYRIGDGWRIIPVDTGLRRSRT